MISLVIGAWTLDIRYIIRTIGNKELEYFSNIMSSTASFPIVDALLLTPKEGERGAIGICTNTSAPGQVFNEIKEEYREGVSVLGSLVVSRDGTERMILNSLAHPALRYLILFSEESLTFSPSTNLLLSLQYGLEKNKGGNYIKDGVAASAHFPNLNERIIDAFRESITVLPIFMFKSDYSRTVVDRYLEWLAPHIPPPILVILTEINKKQAIYYDALNKLIAALEALPAQEKTAAALDPKEFRHLQPPRIELKESSVKLSGPFRVRAEDGLVRLNIALGGTSYSMKGKDDFLMAFSLMKFLGSKKKLLSPLEQLLLGAELGRVRLEVGSDISAPSLMTENKTTGIKEILLEPTTRLKTDKKYYYKINVKDNSISVMCLAFDVCEEVFDLRSKTLPALIERLAELNRFETYEMDFLHRVDVGAQIGRAAIAAKRGYAFIQDFPMIFKINTETLPLVIVQGDTFLDTHKNLLQHIYTNGLTEEHGDKQKGPARSAVALAVYRNAGKALATLPAFYRQGEESTKTMRAAYKKQLLRFDHDGDYSYGERTRAFFGFDQLKKTIAVLKKNPGRAAIVQRFAPTHDMGMFMEEESGKRKYTHDPCLTHDLFFIHDKKLHSFHIARAHNSVNAYPENIFGLYDAYTETIRTALRLKSGDMFMLSSRANILLLTEEQRTKSILGEPSKPPDEMDTSIGPFELGARMKSPPKVPGVAYLETKLSRVRARPKHPALKRLENFEGVNTLEKAVLYLKTKGAMHNNPILTEYQAGTGDPQGEYLAFFQANVMAGKVYAIAVFMNRSLQKKTADIELCNYLATQFGVALGFPLGMLSLFYVAYR